MRDIAIVGHGQSLVGAGEGEDIDAHLDVLRFAKDPADAIVEMTEEDFGDRCDILCFTETGRKRLHLDPRNVGCVQQWCYDKWTGPHEYYLKMYQKLKRSDRAGHLSRGTAAVIMACKKEYTQISLYGFDNIIDRNNEHYLSCYRDLKLTKKYHDYDAEWMVIIKVCRNHKVNLECYPENL